MYGMGDYTLEPFKLLQFGAMECHMEKYYCVCQRIFFHVNRIRQRIYLLTWMEYIKSILLHPHS